MPKFCNYSISGNIAERKTPAVRQPATGGKRYWHATQWQNWWLACREAKDSKEYLTECCAVGSRILLGMFYNTHRTPTDYRVNGYC